MDNVNNFKTSLLTLLLREFLSVESIVAAGLVAALILSMFYGSNELSMSIASGLIGYIGRGKLQQEEANAVHGLASILGKKSSNTTNPVPPAKP